MSQWDGKEALHEAKYRGFEPHAPCMRIYTCKNHVTYVARVGLIFFFILWHETI